jgi:hypothetical protein
MTSVATLFRKARQSKNPKIAAKLRKQAAEMRQSRRVKKRSNGQGERVTRRQARAIERAQRDLVDAREREQQRLEHLDKVRELEAKHRDELKIMADIAHINVICAFIADMEGNQSLYGGALPASVMVSGMTIARIVAELREHGYSTEGKRGIDRKNITKNLI